MTIEPIYLTWLNAKGGFDYFLFKAKNAYNISIEGSGETRNNILPLWPDSYSPYADTLQRQTFVVSRNQILLRSQHLDISQVRALSYIKSSVLVQIVYTRNDKRTVIVDKDSFKKYDEVDKLFTLQFTLSYTDEIPSQTV